VTPPAPAVPVGREERRAVLMAAGGYFCLLCGYYMLRPIREALALDVGPQYNSILFTVVLVVSSALLPIYWWLVGRTPRGRLLWFVCVPFVLVFFCLAIGLSWYPRDRTLAFVYFVSLTSANLYVVSVFWSAMADVWRPELAKRFYGYVAAGGSAGALLGPFIVTSLVSGIGHTPLVIIACVFILGTATLVSAARRSLRRSATGHQVPDAAIPVGGRAIDDLARLARTPYLLGIAGLIIAGQTIGAFMYNEQGRYVLSAYHTVAERTEIFANMEIAVNLLSLVFQAVVVTWLTRRGSVALSLSAMPVLLAASFIVLALYPVGSVLLVTQVLRRAADYGLGKPPREMLFTVLNAESKFKSKSLIDTVLQRGADTGGQWLYVFVAAAGMAGIAWMCAGLCVALLAATLLLGRGFENRQYAGDPAIGPATAK
jgi:AAA family ATP:ADP antiporter